jgi:hypothetical protein
MEPPANPVRFTKLAELMLERELLNEKIAILEANGPLARKRSRR